jgi:PAS domain-containing protein
VNPVAIFDIIAFIGFAGSIVVGVAFHRQAQKIDTRAAVLILLTMASTAFVMFSNTLEHLEITSSLDWMEDLVGIAFFPMLGYAYYLIRVGQEMDELRGTVRAARAEHGMLMNVMDVTPTAIVLVDDAGRITFANEYARSILELPLETRGPYYSSAGVIVPEGGDGDVVSGAVFDAAIAGGGFQNQIWEYVAADVRVPLSVSAAPLADSEGSGAVVVFSLRGATSQHAGEPHAAGP